MWKEFVRLFKRGTLSEEAFREAIVMLQDSKGMFDDAVASLRQDGPLDVDIYARDRQINKFERSVRRKILTHLAVSNNPDATMALVLTTIVMDIERIGDFTKNIVELASETRHAFNAGEIDDEIMEIEGTVSQEMEAIIPALEENDVERARRIITQHNLIGDRSEEIIHSLISGKTLAGDSGTAVTSALYLRYLKRISAHIKNVATSVVNPYHRLGFREKKKVKAQEGAAPAGEEALKP